MNDVNLKLYKLEGFHKNYSLEVSNDQMLEYGYAKFEKFRI